MTDHSKLPDSARLRLFDWVEYRPPYYRGDTTWGEFKELNADGFDEGDLSEIDLALSVNKVVVRYEGAGGSWMAVLLD